MSESKFNFQSISVLVGRHAADPAVLDLIEDPAVIERSEYLGYVELKEVGVSVMFKEAPAGDDDANSPVLRACPRFTCIEMDMKDIRNIRERFPAA